jgi:hypothetical protein
MSSIALSVAGKQALSREDVLPALEDMRRKLMERNVAEVGGGGAGQGERQGGGWGCGWVGRCRQA